MEAVELLQEWVRTIGVEAGCTPENTDISSGSVGVPESRLELDVTFDTLAELEVFWASIPPEKHKAWSQKLQKTIVHGSPQWEIYRTVDAFLPSDGPTTKAASSAKKPANYINENGLVFASGDEVGKYGESLEPRVPSAGETTPSGLSIITDSDEAEVVLDWKGDPMVIKPGDKLPFKF